MALLEEVLPALRAGKKVQRSSLSTLRDGGIDPKAPRILEFTIGALLADDWAVVEDTVDFATAMQALQDGKTVRRSCWDATTYWAIEAGHVTAPVDFGDTPSALRMSAALMDRDIRATDWVICDE